MQYVVSEGTWNWNKYTEINSMITAMKIYIFSINNMTVCMTILILQCMTS
jgi:hypothetical protein